VNPNGRIPAIDDNGFKLWESMAINLYLAKKHGCDLLPKTMVDESQAIQWSFWAMTELEKPALACCSTDFSCLRTSAIRSWRMKASSSYRNRWRCSINGCRQPVI
jgi:glutathione S-transferase